MPWKPRLHKISLSLIFSWLVILTVNGQQPSSHDTSSNGNPFVTTQNSRTRFLIGNIIISGNRVTKPYIITRELTFIVGDSIYLPDLVRAFALARDRLLNTHLFNEVVIYLKGFRGYAADIGIDVKERWYIFPLPYLHPVDRNLTAWAEKNYSLSRLNYGLRYSQYNFTGRNDNLRIWLITGYSRQAEIAYDQPYADKTLKHGFGGGISFTALKEVNVATKNNQQYFINADSITYAGKFLRTQLNVSLRYYYRPALKTRHYVRLVFTNIGIDSAVSAYSPDYLKRGLRNVFYPELSYVINYNNVDYVPYPLRGFLIEGGITHRGINSNFNLWQAYTKIIRAWPITKRISANTQNGGVLKLPFNQPFFNQQFIGYNDYYMRGLEKYVVDGVAGWVSRNTLLYELFHFNIPFLRGTSHDIIPFRFYAKLYGDWGYVYNQNFRDNSLVNRILYSGGAGIDMVTFYDFVFRVEYSMNQLGEKGLFLHVRNDF